MLSVSNLSKSYGDQDLFRGLSFTIGMSDRVAVIGQNGTGKTTLLDIIAGQLVPDSGNVSLRSGTTVGYLHQDDARAFSQHTLLEEVCRASDTMNSLEHKVQAIREDLVEERDEETVAALLKKLGEVQHLYELRGGYESEHEAEVVLAGLGFAESDFERPLSEFSGGWQTRIALARLLFLSPDILLLDEPTNHLDLETQRWFESYLSSYSGAVLVTSHDRAFLNSIANKTVSIEAEGTVFYHGNYDSYVLARQKEIEIRQATARRQEREISREMRFIERFRAKNTKATQVQSRVKKLEKMERVTVPRTTKKIHFTFPEPARSGQKVIELKYVAKSYGDHVVYQDLNLVLERGDRAAIVGVNGAGKTTLLRILAGVLPFEKGTRVLGHNTALGYFAQYYVESLCAENTILDELRGVAPDEPEQRLRGLLGAFLFSGDDVTKRISVLSGGEKTRVAIARILTRPANLLLLDEPTNHLDIPSREMLTDALDAYKGTMCFITHDRTLIREIANKIVEVRNGQVTVFPCHYDEYLRQSERAETEEMGAAEASGEPPQERPGGSKEKRRRKANEAQVRNEHYRLMSPIKKRIEEIEQEVRAAAGRIEEIGLITNDPDSNADWQKVVSMNLEYEALKEKVAALTAEWEGCQAESERLESEYRRVQEELGM